MNAAHTNERGAFVGGTYAAFCVAGRWYVRLPNGHRSAAGDRASAEQIAARGNELLARRKAAG
jgi:hypothetical protein